MQKRKFGYCCINLSLQEGKKENRITANRGMTSKTFHEKGVSYASQLAKENTCDLRKIILWNNLNGIKMYRMSSDMFPWFSEYEIKDLPDFEAIRKNLEFAGDEAKKGGQRITFHPSHFNVLASLNPDVVKKSIKEIDQHAEIMDLMGLERSHYYPINIHVNTTQPSKEAAAERFCENFQLLSEGARDRLVVEIDDKTSQFNVGDLKMMVYDRIGVPITFDFLHNKCNPAEDLTERDALEICLNTWPSGVVPLTHYSESKKLFEDASSKLLAHSDWIHEKIETYGFDFDIELEVKMKEKALLNYHEKLESILHE
jgi:UV DNA damage endonuclease